MQKEVSEYSQWLQAMWPAFFSRRWKYRGCFQLAKDGRNVQTSRMHGGVGVILHSPNRFMLIYSWRLNFNFRICSVIDIRNIEFKYLNHEVWINTRDNDIQLFSDLYSLRGFGCSIFAEEDLLLTYCLCPRVGSHCPCVSALFVRGE
jgi:hypothetical protein